MTWHRSKYYLIPLLTTLFLLFSCSRRSNDDRSLARVEDRSLTLDDLRDESELVYFSLGETAERWIDEQVLLYHFNRSEIIDESQLAIRLKEYENRLIAGMLLDSLLHRDIKIDPELIREYYVNNQETFQFQDSAALVIHLGFLNPDSASAALEILGGQPTARDSVLNRFNFDRQLVYRRRTLPVLDQAIFAAEAGQFYGPLATDFGYHLIFVENFYLPGETIPFSLVRKQIFEHLYNEQLPLARSSIIDSLRETTDIEVY